MSLRCLAVVTLICLGCGARPQPAARTAPAGPVFIVPRDGVIVEVDADGRLLRTIARVPAEELWLLPGGAFLARDANTLRRVRSDGQVDLTIELPAIGECSDDDVNSGLFPQSGNGVDRDGRVAHATMAELEYDAMFNVEVTVCLETGGVYVDPETVPDGCMLTPMPVLSAPPCLADTNPPASSETQDEHRPDPHAPSTASTCRTRTLSVARAIVSRFSGGRSSPTTAQP